MTYGRSAAGLVLLVVSLPLGMACSAPDPEEPVATSEEELAAVIKLGCGQSLAFAAEGYGGSRRWGYFTWPDVYATLAEATAAAATKNGAQACQGLVTTAIEMAGAEVTAKADAVSACQADPLGRFSCGDLCGDGTGACQKTIGAFSTPCHVTTSSATVKANAATIDGKHRVTCIVDATATAAGQASAGCTARMCNDGAGGSGGGASDSGGESASSAAGGQGAGSPSGATSSSSGEADAW